MKKLVPETLGKSIFRRYNRVASPRLSERRGLRPGYAGINRPLVWRAALRQADAGSGNPSFLLRRHRYASREAPPQDEGRPAAELPRSAKPMETAPAVQPVRSGASARPVKVLRKPGVSARRTVVELPPSRKSQEEAQAGPVEKTPVQRKLKKPTMAPQPAPMEEKAPPPAEEGGSSRRTQATRSKQSSPSESKASPVARPEPQPEPHEPALPASGKKPGFSQEARPEGKDLASPGGRDRPAPAGIRRKAAPRVTHQKSEVEPDLSIKPSGEEGAKPRPALVKPETGDNSARKSLPEVTVATADAPKPIARRKSAQKERTAQQPALKPAAKATTVKKAGPARKLLPAPPGDGPVQAKVKGRPARAEGKPAAPEGSRPPARQAVPRVQRKRAAPVEPPPAGRTSPAPEKQEWKPEAKTTAEVPAQATHGAQAAPTQTEKPTRSAPPPAEKSHRVAPPDARPAEKQVVRRVEKPGAQRPAASAVPERRITRLEPLVQPTRSAVRGEVVRKPGPLPLPPKPAPASGRVQREAAPAEAPAETPPSPTPQETPVPAVTPAPPVEVGEKLADNERMLDEMAYQVYQILQRRLQIEFERDHGLAL
jgi:hypothetical protein